MAEVRPFRGLRYQEALSAGMSALIAPPYDVIPPEREPVYRGRSPHNVIRLELPEEGPEGHRYGHAAALLETWKRESVLRFDERPAVYLYQQTYALPGGGERTRSGVFALLRLEPFEAGVVLPHEQTFSKYKEDRYQLLSACRTQISPIFGLYHAPGGVVSRWVSELGRLPADVEAADDEGVRHRMWPITDAGRLEAWRAEMAGVLVFLADGHHRYETALRYQAERRAAGEDVQPAWYDHVMILLVEMSDPGLVLFPTHRVVRMARPVEWGRVRARLGQWFEHRDVPLGSAEELAGILPAGVPVRLAMLAPPGDRIDLWTLRDAEAVDRVVPAGRSEAWRRLDVVALHELVFGEALGRAREPEALSVGYTRDVAQAIQSVRQSADTQTAAFFMRAPTMEEVQAVSLAGDRMPEKTTYFWPKAVTGMVLHASGGFGADL